jgi:hypothetical protein
MEGGKGALEAVAIISLHPRITAFFGNMLILSVEESSKRFRGGLCISQGTPLELQLTFYYFGTQRHGVPVRSAPG